MPNIAPPITQEVKIVIFLPNEFSTEHEKIKNYICLIKANSILRELRSGIPLTEKNLTRKVESLDKYLNEAGLAKNETIIEERENSIAVAHFNTAKWLLRDLENTRIIPGNDLLEYQVKSIRRRFALAGVKPGKRKYIDKAIKKALTRLEEIKAIREQPVLHSFHYTLTANNGPK